MFYFIPFSPLSVYSMRLFLILTSMLLISSMAVAQIGRKSSNSGKDLYYKYEREEVAYYRDVVDFQLPEPMIEVEELSDEPRDAIKLSHLFPVGEKLYIDADEELQKMIEKDKEEKSRIRTIPGYRIQAYTGASRADATKRKNSLMGQYSGHISYLKYEMPNYIILVGDFMDKEDATLFCRQLRMTVPGAFVVPDQIPVPRYRTEVEEDEDNMFPKSKNR